jgi:putative oxidoreductase
MKTLLQSLVVLLSRALLCQIFLISAVGHLFNWGGTTQYMAAQGMFLVHFMLAGAVAFLLAGGLSVLLGYYARCGSILLIVFLLMVTPIFHNFWAYESSDPQRMMQTINFMKNTGLAGGLLMVLAFGSGGLSLDAIWPLRRRSSTRNLG